MLTIAICLAGVLIHHVAASEVSDRGFDGKTYDWDYGKSAEKTYILTNVHWWESPDHQMTSVVSLLALAKNTSSIAVIPSLSTRDVQIKSDKSLLGDFFDLKTVNEVQPAMTLVEFMNTDDYKLLRKEATGTVSLPKNSQEEYEAKLGIFGMLQDTNVRLEMPPVDPEHTNQKCNSFGGAIHVSSDGKRRYVFMNRIHFLHFCFEKFMPWWYDVRHRIAPRKPYYDVVNKLLEGKEHPITTIHISDLMASQKKRDDEEIERYARQIVDSLRKNQAITGTMFLTYQHGSRNVHKVVQLLKQEFDNIIDCSASYFCEKPIPMDIFDPPLSAKEHQKTFGGAIGSKTLVWALGARSDLFVGNIYSPFSRNICLHRKTHGKPYAVLKGFGELRKIWSWNL